MLFACIILHHYTPLQGVYIENEVRLIRYIFCLYHYYQLGHRFPDFHIYIPGGRLNKKDGLTRYGNSHVKDKTS